MSEDTKVFNSLPGVILSDLADSTLIIPSISIGNIPQLANDLLIHTLNFNKIGSLNDTYLYPFASPIDTLNDVGQKKGISTAVGVYHNKELKLTIIQQRSPIIPSFTKTYVNEVILPFIKEANVKKFLILDSSDAGLVENLSPGTIDFYSNEDVLNKSLETLNIGQVDAIQLGKGDHNHSSYIRSLITYLHTGDLSSDFEVNVLVSYVYEGDNFYDGEHLADKTIEALDVSPVKNWIRPRSWLGVYGDRQVPNAMEEGLFG